MLWQKDVRLMFNATSKSSTNLSYRKCELNFVLYLTAPAPHVKVRTQFQNIFIQLVNRMVQLSKNKPNFQAKYVSFI